MAVTMRSFLPDRCDAVWEYTSHFPECHGAPLGRNSGRELGIPELDTTISGNAIQVPEGTDRLYWACGVTPKPGGSAGPASARALLHARPRPDHGYSD